MPYQSIFFIWGSFSNWKRRLDQLDCPGTWTYETKYSWESGYICPIGRDLTVEVSPYGSLDQRQVYFFAELRLSFVV